MQESTVPHDGVFKISSPSEKRNLNQRLSWGDLVFVSSKSWGLRNAKSATNTAKEKANGFTGDALAISSVGNLLSDGEFFRLVDPKKVMAPDNRLYQDLMVTKTGLDELNRIKSLRYVLRANLMNTMPFASQNELLNKFEVALTKFIHDSLQTNMRERDHYINDPISTLQQDLSTNGFGFILGDFSGGDSGYDIPQYYGLGKCGKEYRKPSKVVDAITSEGKIKDLLANSQQDTFLDDLTENFFQEIVASIQKQRQK